MTDYSYTKQVYKNVPFQWVVRKKGYYNIQGFACRGYDIGAIIAASKYDVYSGLDLSSEQLTGSPMTIKIENGELPDRSYCGDIYGVLKATGQSYNVLKSAYTNYTTEGTPTINIDTGIVSNFSTSNYLKLPSAFSPSTSTWECKFKVKTPNDVTGNGKIFYSRKADNSTFGDRYGIGAILISSKWGLFASADGSSWLFDTQGTYTVLANTVYWVKFGWNGTAYYLEYSLDGTTYTRDITYNSNSNLCNMAVSYLGIYRGDSFGTPWQGSMDLSECSISINGATWWSPVGSASTTAIGLLPSGVTDDGSTQTWNLFYNNGTFLADTESSMTGHSWCGTISVPAHSI